ncbi:hypothetical protein [Phaeocystidibacter luteus]|uniref:Uncharacterized protein n=1 Tax=Phaeocystidibacter luteus TaxID=911197 RepID=A0A6N6REB3_9FLAO|nr:hypothetical protein [Phaeocystidibacter luteus]KAB2808087.1 hypothetical protein F8C67_10990 [Phaeocystidibacter luteus]
MLRNLALASGICLSGLAFSQGNPLHSVSASLDWGPLIEIDDISDYEIIETDGDTLFIKALKSEGYLSRMSLQLIKMNKNTFDIFWTQTVVDEKFADEYPELNDFYYVDGRFMILSSCYLDDQEQFVRLRQFVNNDGSTTPYEVIGSIKAEDEDDGYFYLYFDENREEFFYNTYQTEYDKEEDLRQHHVTILDFDLKVLFEYDHTFDYTYENCGLEEKGMDAEGNYYFLYSYPNPRYENNNDLPMYLYSIMRFDRGTSLLEEVKIPSNDYNLKTRDLILDNKNDQIVFTGLYENEKFDGPHGTFFFKVVQSTWALEYSEFTPFELSLQREYLDDDDIEDGDGLDDNLVLRRVIRRGDGGLLCLYQINYYTKRRVRTENGSYYEYTYVDNDLIAINHNSNGTVAWSKRIPKEFVDDTRAFQGFSITTLNDKLFIFYLDDEDSQEYWSGEDDEISDVDMNSDTYVAMVTLDISGNITYVQIEQGEDDDDLWFAPRASIGTGKSNGELIMLRRDDDDFEEIRIGRFQAAD